jgi:hypothetical protein
MRQAVLAVLAPQEGEAPVEVPAETPVEVAVREVSHHVAEALFHLFPQKLHHCNPMDSLGPNHA